MTDLFPTEMTEKPGSVVGGENVDTNEQKEVVGKSTEYCPVEQYAQIANDMSFLFPNQCTVTDGSVNVGENVVTTEPTEVIGKSTEFCPVQQYAQLQNDMTNWFPKQFTEIPESGAVGENVDTTEPKQNNARTIILEEMVKKSGDEMLELLKELSTSYNVGEDKPYFKAEIGFFNDNETNVLCWMNSLLMIMLHQIPVNVLWSLKQFEKTRWIDKEYSSERKKFVGYTYDMIRQMSDRSAENMEEMNGNVISAPYAEGIANIYRSHYNNKCFNLHLGRKDFTCAIDVLGNGMLEFFNDIDPLNDNFCLGKMRYIYKLDEGGQEICGDGNVTLFELPGCNDMIKEWQNGYTTAMKNYKPTKRNKNSNEWSESMKFKMQNFQSTWKQTINPNQIVEKIVQRIYKCDGGEIEREYWLEGMTRTTALSRFVEFSEFPKILTITLGGTCDVEAFDEEPEGEVVDPKLLTEKELKDEEKYFTCQRTGRTMKQTTGNNILVNAMRQIPLKYEIVDINKVVEIQERPSRFVTKDEIARKYQICGVVVRPTEKVNIDEGHYECFVKTNKSHAPDDEEWMHFDDTDINKRNTIQKKTKVPNFKNYSAIVVFMKDVTSRKDN